MGKHLQIISNFYLMLFKLTRASLRFKPTKFDWFCSNFTSGIAKGWFQTIFFRYSSENLALTNLLHQCSWPSLFLPSNSDLIQLARETRPLAKATPGHLMEWYWLLCLGPCCLQTNSTDPLAFKDIDVCAVETVPLSVPTFCAKQLSHWTWRFQEWCPGLASLRCLGNLLVLNFLEFKMPLIYCLAPNYTQAH